MRSLLAAASVAFLVTVGAAHGQRNVEPQLRLLDVAPVTLRGVDFESLESVRLVVKLGDRKVARKLQAARSGSFTTSYPALRYTRCNGSLVVSATGGRGSRVSWELHPLDCPIRADT